MASWRHCPEAPWAELTHAARAEESREGGLRSGLESGTGPGTGPAAAGLPARGESWVLLSHPTSAETARGFSPGVQAQEERS